MQEIDGSSCAGKSLAGNAGQASALAADGHVEALVSFFPQTGDGYVLAHLDAAPDIHTYLTHHVDFSGDHILLQLI